ncbi:transglycosylase domain-containing protein [Chloroflexi bacterium TSY]|nr:transglycosylase domain-containing protein [Chloroflexi bacterium TSY]
MITLLRLTSLSLFVIFGLTGCVIEEYVEPETIEYFFEKKEPSPNTQTLSHLQNASRLQGDVEAYLQEYQPGPIPRLFQTTYIYDRNGILIAELFDEGRREWVSLEQISPFLIEATIATEDATFYTNLGVDPFRVASAAFQNVKEGKIVSGASTITMQLARNLFMTLNERTERSFERKSAEAAIARELTRFYTKDDLLEMYLNLLNYGRLAYGPEAAAQVYFGKSAAELSRGEAIFLAGLPQQPAELDPFRNMPAAKRRQRQVLDIMVRKLKLTQMEADRIYTEPLAIRSEPGLSPNLAPHFVQYLEDKIDARLGDQYLRRSGLHIYTTLDLRFQELAQGIAREKVAQRRSHHGMNNAALVAMHVETGEVLALMGSLDFDDPSIDGQVNVALSPRQPGSTMKPLLFATAINDLLLSPATVLWDTPVSYHVGSGVPYKPRNYDNRFHGLVTVRTALSNSYNVPAVKVINALGVRRMVESSRRLGLRSLSRPVKTYGLALSLGDSEVTLLDMTTSYRTIANGGLYSEPKTVVAAVDKQGETSLIATKLLEADQIEPSAQVISSGAAFVITDILSDNEARSPTFGRNSRLKLERPAAAKTGTTTNWRDNWTIGYTRYLVTGVWVGNSDGRPMRNTTGASGAAPIWHDFMDAVIAEPKLLEALNIPRDSQSDDTWEFDPPPDVEKHAECRGSLPCRKEGEYFTLDWLNALGDAGPLGDTVLTAETIPVHADRAGNPWMAVYCMPDGIKKDERILRGLKERTLVNLVGRTGIGQSGDMSQSDSQLYEQAGFFRRVFNQDVGGTELVFYPEIELEQFRTISWGSRRGVGVYIGRCADLTYYTVQPGDYWSSIAKSIGLNARELQGANAHIMRRGGTLHPGQRLLVPEGHVVRVAKSGPAYVVQSGDTWNSISNNFEISLGLLLATNPDVVRPGYLLRPGDKLLIPDLDLPDTEQTDLSQIGTSVGS